MLTTSAQNKFLRIVAMIACYAMIFIDESGIAVTLPMMQQTLSLTNNTVHWVINSYLLTLSVLLLVGGKLSDIYGKRKIFILGIFIFLFASIICASAQSTWMLLIGRLIQGVGASLLMPCITVIIRNSVADNEFGAIFGLVLGFANFFYATGPLIGGILTEFASWRWFFWVNIPIGLTCFCFTFLAVEKDIKNPTVYFSDIKGLVIFIVALTALVFAIMQGADWGWRNGWIISLFVVAIVGLLLFVKIELHEEKPLLDIHLFLNKIFSAGMIILFCAALCLTSMVFLALWLQTSLGFSPATVGLALLPASLFFIFIPTIAGIWQDRAGARQPLLLGSSLIFGGILWIIVTINLQSYAWIFIGLLAFGCGIPLTIPPSVMTIMQSVSQEQSGMASGAFTSVRQLALSMGIAILSAIITSYNNWHLTKWLASTPDYSHITLHQVQLLLAGKNIMQQFSADELMRLKQTAGLIYTHAFMYGMIVMALFAAIACLCAFIFVKK